MVIASGQQRLPRRRAERGGVHAVVLETLVRELLEVRRLARATERARRAEADVVDQHDQNVRRARRRLEPLDRRELRVGILRVEGGQSDWWPVWYRQDGARNRCFLRHDASP